jgi:hypothetical protein
LLGISGAMDHLDLNVTHFELFYIRIVMLFYFLSRKSPKSGINLCATVKEKINFGPTTNILGVNPYIIQNLL